MDGSPEPAPEIAEPPAEPFDPPPLDPEIEEPEGYCPQGTTIPDEVPLEASPEVDILVVVDNSGSMAAEQALLVEAFPTMVRSLLTGLDGEGNRAHAPVRDLHLGVVSTDMGAAGYDVRSCEQNPPVGDDGILQHTPRWSSCAREYPLYLSYWVEPGADPDMDQIEQMSEDFGCIGVLDTDGCAYEHPLDAAYKALVVHSRPGGPNEGFLRPGSILTILFVTDEEDCSASDPTLFDISDIPYHVNLQCHYQAAKLHPVERYALAFRTLRESPEGFVLGFIVGVPPDEPSCNGRGDELEGCLGHPAMEEVIADHGEFLEYTCRVPETCTPPEGLDPGNCISEATPGRRFVRLAQMFGRNAVVQSICTDSFAPAIEALTEKLQETIASKTFTRPLDMESDPHDACRCTASCVLIEVLSDDRPCRDLDADGSPDIHDADGDTLCDARIDDVTGLARSMCELPQAGSIMENCALSCDDPTVSFSRDPSRAGWWYDHSHDTNGDTVRDYTVFYEGLTLEQDSDLVFECCL